MRATVLRLLVLEKEPLDMLTCQKKIGKKLAIHFFLFLMKINFITEQQKWLLSICRNNEHLPHMPTAITTNKKNVQESFIFITKYFLPLDQYILEELLALDHPIIA